MKKYFQFLLLIGSVLFYSSTAMAKELTKAEEIADHNSNILADYIANEIWNKPIKELFRGSLMMIAGRKSFHPEAVVMYRKIDKQFTYDEKKAPILSGSTSLECNPDWKTPSLFAKISYRDHEIFKKGRQYSIKIAPMLKNDVNHNYREDLAGKMDFHPGWAIKEREKSGNKDTSVLCYYSDDNRSLASIPLVSPAIFTRKLEERGLPLNYCHSEYGEIDLHSSVQCSIDWHMVNYTDGTHSPFVASFKFSGPSLIKTEANEKAGDGINYIEISELNIGKDESNLSMAQIYKKRLADPQYLETAKAFNEEMKLIYQEKVATHDEYIKGLIAKKYEEEAEAERKYQASLRRNNSSDGYDSSFKNPYHLGRQEGDFLTAIGSNSQNIQKADTLRQQKNSPETQTPSSDLSQTYRANQGASKISTSSSIHPQDLEKQNCINAGKKWLSGGGCDYSSTVNVQGWSQGNTTARNESAHLQTSSSETKYNASSSSIINQNTNNNGSLSNSQTVTNNQNSDTRTKGMPGLTMIVVREETNNSWSTQEVACSYAKDQVIERAKKQCEDDYNGEPATTADIPIPIDANCQSYRQMTKSNIGEWVATGNVTFYCRH